MDDHSHFFYISQCPLHEECSEAAWKRASIWAWSEEQARERLREHLRKSGRHSSAKAEDIDVLCELVEVVKEEWAEPQAKRARPAAARAPPALDTEAIAVRVAEKAMSSAPLAIPMSTAKDDMVLVPKAQLAAAVDALTRAQMAARSAQRLAEGASQTFSAEASVFHEVKTTLSSFIR